MRAEWHRSIVLSTSLILVFIIVAVFSTGCEEKNDASYQNAVLGGWSKLESTTEVLVEASNAIEGQGDFEGFSSKLAEAREEIDSYRRELNNLEVPDQYAESQAALEDFLSAYDSYLEANENTIDIVLSGDAEKGLPTVVPMLEDAQQGLEDYRDSQEYNPAGLSRYVWDIPHILDEAMMVAGGGGLNPGNTIDERYAKALDTIGAWYAFFNAGDGESMYALLDSDSPVKSGYDKRFLLTLVTEAYLGEVRATHHFVSAGGDANTSPDRVTVYLTVDYTATVNMEGEPVPPSSEERMFEMVKRGDSWYVYDIQATGDPAFY